MRAFSKGFLADTKKFLCVSGRNCDSSCVLPVSGNIRKRRFSKTSFSGLDFCFHLTRYFRSVPRRNKSEAARIPWKKRRFLQVPAGSVILATIMITITRDCDLKNHSSLYIDIHTRHTFSYIYSSPTSHLS